MNEEIKEILDYLKDNDNYIEDIGGEHKRIGLYEAKILLDYITNLQEENVVLKSQLLQDNKSYHNMQDRIKKAIELLNDWNYLDKIDCYCEPKEVIEILQGKSDE